MGCTGSDWLMSELEFARAMTHDRPTEDLWACRGPKVTNSFTPSRLAEIECGMRSSRASTVLWANYRGADEGRLWFRCCVAHWYDMAALLAASAMVLDDSDYMHESMTLLQQTTKKLEWDLKELSNMLQWQRVGG